MNYDTIIIAEKPIAGKTIALLLSDNDFEEIKEKNHPTYTFETKILGNAILIPLKGHITDVDFPPKYSNWYLDQRELVKSGQIIYKMTEPIIAKILSETNGKRIIIATDADREGESIGREAINILIQKNPKIKIERAYFSSITKDEIEETFAKPSVLNPKLADAADARREIDLYWGAALTRNLSTTSGMVGHNFLSVGRVQSPTLEKVVARENEINNFISTPYWEIQIDLHNSSLNKEEARNENKKEETFTAEHKKGRFTKKEEAGTAFAKIEKTAKVINIEKKETTLKRPEPLNTTDFLRQASAMNIDTVKAMEIAERLYMQGYVSYPRTDNREYVGVNFNKILTNLRNSEFDKSIDLVLSQDKIVPSKGTATKDHPPIHPVDLPDKNKLSKYEWQIFKLIVDHFLATLYKDAKANTTTVELDANSEIFVAKGLIFIERGWLDIYKYVSHKEAVLPPLSIGDILDILDKRLLSKKTQPPPRYSQGTLIKLMEKFNLGTKSTRPAILQKLYGRKYISGQNQIVPSEIAKVVIETLQKHADEVVTPDMTAKLEDEMNGIEEDKATKEGVVEDSRQMLLHILEVLYKNKQNIAQDIKKVYEKANSFGSCPICGSNLKKIKSFKGKFFVGCSKYPDCRQAYPLPQSGEFSYANKQCEVCKAPIITRKVGRTTREFCINPQCKTNKDFYDNYNANKNATNKEVKKETESEKLLKVEEKKIRKPRAKKVK